MPYKRRYGKRRYRKSSGTTSLSNVINMASKAYKLAAFVASVINPEVKFVDVTQSGYGQGTTVTRDHISPIAQGDGTNQRNGDSIKTKDWLIRGNIQIPLAAEGTYHIVRFRVLAIIDTQNQGTPPAITEVLDTTNGMLDAPRQTTTQVGNRFIHLMDRRLTLTVGGKQSIDFKHFSKLGHHIHYSGANATDELAGNIWIYYISDQNTNPPTFSYTSRLSYYDN